MTRGSPAEMSNGVTRYCDGSRFLGSWPCRALAVELVQNGSGSVGQSVHSEVDEEDAAFGWGDPGIRNRSGNHQRTHSITVAVGTFRVAASRFDRRGTQ